MTSSEFSVVNIENGPIRGLKTKNIFGSDYYSFRGIPYMKAPVGKLRFREAEVADSWIDPYDATKEGPSYCMTDFMTGLQDGQENGGIINIYTNRLESKELLPVMIWVRASLDKKNIKSLYCRIYNSINLDSRWRVFERIQSYGSIRP